MATDAKIQNGIFYLFDDEDQNSIIVSKEMKFGLNALRLTLGYNLGSVAIYGSQDGIVWQFVDTIYVDTLEIKFMKLILVLLIIVILKLIIPHTMKFI